MSTWRYYNTSESLLRKRPAAPRTMLEKVKGRPSLPLSASPSDHHHHHKQAPNNLSSLRVE